MILIIELFVGGLYKHTSNSDTSAFIRHGNAPVDSGSGDGSRSTLY